MHTGNLSETFSFHKKKKKSNNTEKKQRVYLIDLDEMVLKNFHGS